MFVGYVVAGLFAWLLGFCLVPSLPAWSSSCRSSCHSGRSLAQRVIKRLGAEASGLGCFIGIPECTSGTPISTLVLFKDSFCQVWGVAAIQWEHNYGNSVKISEDLKQKLNRTLLTLLVHIDMVVTLQLYIFSSVLVLHCSIKRSLTNLNKLTLQYTSFDLFD